METIQILSCMMILMSESDNRYTSINELHLFKALEKSERADFDSALFFCLFLEISLIKAFIKSNFSIIK